MTDYFSLANQPTERFVSLYGFFAIHYPKYWKQETDVNGQYVFFNEQGGSGVARIIVFDNEFEGADASKKVLESFYIQHKDFTPLLLAAGNNRFVHFVKEHEVNGAVFTIYYWAAAKGDKVLLITYTVQTSMKDMDTAVAEKQDMEMMIASLVFLHENTANG